MTERDEESWEQGFTEGIDEAVRQVNEELDQTPLGFRFVNAGLNTVCKIGVMDYRNLMERRKAKRGPKDV